ncbi:non-ribosomal peptide synthetase [Erwinia psidii]|uniref:Amino acid adenylation domain-containing protein n=1 Tax=Erwinia psidii TaxID=69224 RepID=A0A3N6SL45_9GAMM|nr:non-ribosomal peptide synthetase [Erwinia psidii]MCX8957643.1 amino acid adenylation domain-containing protein [Erwinia psidii]MCX8960697.1 amino acid adenylation domain-containing protein [Erwinia psidii]MCX8964058.1 amino acid adenylation domain-containing protein [Erwinia psidii]RQM39541.1 amino acid adenylation domain-containing protein [Erwinia psidii]
MTPATLLKQVEQAGLKISLLDGNLKLEGATQNIAPSLVASLREHKSALLNWLQQRTTSFPLTPLQQAYYRGRSSLFDGGGVANQVYHEIEGCWQPERLEMALQRVIAAHSALRLRMVDDNAQFISDEVPAITRHDLRGLTAQQQQQARARLREEKSHLVLAPEEALLRVDLILLAANQMVLCINHDGMIIDGISMFLLFHHWHRHYQGEADAADYLAFDCHIDALQTERGKAAWQRSRDYWLARIPTLPSAPELPQTAQATSQPARFSQRVVSLDATAWQQLQRHIRAQQLTPATVLMAAYAETLYQWGAGEHFTLNVTVSERRPIHPQAFRTIGPFSAPLLVEVTRDPQLTFPERASVLQRRLHQDVDHRHFSGIEVMQALARQRGLAAARMPCTFNCTLGALEGVNGDALTQFGEEVFSISQTPQVLLDAFVFEQHGALIIRLDGVDASFPTGFLTALAAGYQRMLNQLCQPHGWQQLQFDLLPDDQRQRRDAVNATQMPVTPRLLGDDFAVRARQQPAALALCTLDRQLSYGELCNRVAEAAQWLKSQGVERNTLVGLVADRSPEHAIGILAIVLAGAAYLPIDAGLPAARRDFMLRDGEVRLVLTNVDLACGLPQFDLRYPQPGTYTLPPRDPGASPDDLAYVLYTSGTTGQPKGVMVTHRNVINVLDDCQRRFNIVPEDRFFAISAFNFDLSVWDLFGALSAGAALAIPDADKSGDAEHWGQLCAKYRVSVWNSVPAIVRMMHDYSDAMPSSLRLLMMSGDRIPPDLPAAIAVQQPAIRQWSLGGPTETTIWNICHPISAEDCAAGIIPYGRPNANNQCLICHPQGTHCPDWVAGEILASGAGITPGYWRDETRTRERYAQATGDQPRYFRTGDLGRYLPDGNIEILGRVDLQIKLNGYRIEAGDVEAALVKLTGISEAAVVAAKSASGDILVAHLVGDDAGLNPERMRQALRQHLPDYMIPSRFCWHQALPLNRNLKVDRKALAQFSLNEAAAPAASVAENSAIENQLQGIWQSVLPASQLSRTHDFFSVGGNSLSALRILTVVRKTFGVSLPLESIYQFNTVQSMAAHIATRGNSE